MKTGLKTTPQKLREKFVQTGMTPGKASKESNLSASTISRLLSKPCNVTYGTAAALEKLFGENTVTIT